MADRLRQRSFCNASSMVRPGPTWTLPARRWARQKPISTRAGERALAFVSWISWWRSITKPGDDGNPVLPPARHDAGKRTAAAARKIHRTRLAGRRAVDFGGAR